MVDADVCELLDELIERIIDADHPCDDCSLLDPSVRRQTRSAPGAPLLYLCESCADKRRADAQRVLHDLESLAMEVEQRLRAIENTERELDQWRDAQLQKNREFWDEYRRQVENFSACRIRSLQYEFSMKQMRTERLMKRLKRAKYIGEHIDELREQLISVLHPAFVNLIGSEHFQNQFSLFLSTTDEHGTDEQRRDFLEQLACLDQILIPADQLDIDDDLKIDLEE